MLIVQNCLPNEWISSKMYRINLLGPVIFSAFFSLKFFAFACLKKYGKNMENYRRIPKIHTLYNVILRIARNFLETRENVKILTHPVYHMNLDWFSWEWSKKNFFFLKKKNQNGWFFKMADFSKWPFFKMPILEIFSWKFHRLVLGLVGLIDEKAIWLWGCLT